MIETTVVVMAYRSRSGCGWEMCSAVHIPQSILFLFLEEISVDFVGCTRYMGCFMGVDVCTNRLGRVKSMDVRLLDLYRCTCFKRGWSSSTLRVFVCGVCVIVSP